jgi:hypothetical protein
MNALCHYNEGQCGANGDRARGLAVPVTQGGSGCVGAFVRRLSVPLRGEVGAIQGLCVAHLSSWREGDEAAQAGSEQGLSACAQWANVNGNEKIAAALMHADHWRDA